MTWSRNVCFGFTEAANNGNLLLIPSNFSKHAEVEHRAHGVCKLHNHVGIIQNVRALAVIKLVQVVYVLGTASHHAYGRGLCN